jgi:hypothetical protein
MRALTLALFMLSSSAANAAPTAQRIVPVPTAQVVTAGDLATVTLVYDSNDATTTGVGVQVHYDSVKLHLEGVSGLYANGSLGAGDQAEISIPDEYPESDRAWVAAWVHIDGEWPGEGVELPLDLVTLRFRTRAGYESALLHITGSACGGCSLELTDATLELTDSGPSFTPTPTPSITPTPSPLPTPTLGPSPTGSGPAGPFTPGPPQLTPTVSAVAVPAATSAGLVVLALALAAIGYTVLVRRR